MSENQDGSEAEDVPSDFFDDFNKEEFMEGLSVVDSWDEDKPRSRINAEAVESVRDLRELIRDGREDERRRSGSRCRLDDYIKPGSRRDPNKTNEAIRRDKAVKVKQFLAKSLEAGDDLRPPGTELDDFFDETKLLQRTSKEPSASHRSRSRPFEEQDRRRESPAHRRRHSPMRRRSPDRRSPFRPYKNRHQYGNYQNRRFSPRRFNRRSPISSRHRSRSRSPRRSPRRSPHRSPRRSPRRDQRSRSPRRDRFQRSRSRSPRRDSFLYPNEPHFPENMYPPQMQFPGPMPTGYPGPVPEYPFGPGPSVPGFNAPPYEFHQMPPVAMPMAPPMPVPQPVPAPIMPGMAGPAPMNSMPLPQLESAVPAPGPSIAPAISPVPPVSNHNMDIQKKTPYDALAQLVAAGKLSKEDYLKLAPHKSGSSALETKARVDVLNRCNAMLSRLSNNIRAPNKLMMNNAMLGPEPKAIAPKYCSPLKRQATIDFSFTSPNASTNVAHNKQLVEAILNTVGLNNDIVRPKKKQSKNLKDAATQTTKPYCDVCEIREATRFYDTATAIDPEYFCSSIHTQVVEQDLLSSKAVFAPSGSIADGAPLSIAHLTPAQLVSQLAARAKTLKQSEPPPGSASQYGRRPPSYDYDRGQQYQGNYGNSYGRY